MDPEVPYLLAFALAFFVFVYSTIRSKHKHELAKLDRIAAGSADRSLTTHELEEMIKDIVSETTGPMQDQLNDLAARLNASSDPRLLDPDESTVDVPGQQKSLGRRTRA